MDERVNTRTRHPSGLNTWRAGCGGSRTSGSEGGPEQPTRRKPGKALRSDPYSKLPGPARGIYYSLYAVIDIFSRYIVAWCVAAREDAELAKELIGDAVDLHDIAPGQLSVHATVGRR